MQAPDKPAPMTDIHDIKALEIWAGRTDWIWIAAALALLLAATAAAIFFWKKYRKQQDAYFEILISPDQEALNALDAISDVENRNGKAFYFSLSNILRAYMQARFTINALEMTTEELIPKLDGLHMDKNLYPELKALLRSSDPVKFAGFPVTTGKMRDDLAFVRHFVLQTTERVEKVENEVKVPELPGTAAVSS